MKEGKRGKKKDLVKCMGLCDVHNATFGCEIFKVECCCWSFERPMHKTYNRQTLHHFIVFNDAGRRRKKDTTKIFFNVVVPENPYQAL